MAQKKKNGPTKLADLSPNPLNPRRISPRQFKPEFVPIADLKPHPRNYRSHPDDQLSHLEESLRTNGFYRNVVVACDNTILAGHGIVEAARRQKVASVPVVRLPLALDDPRALKVLTGDNTLSHLAEDNERLLTEMLKEIKDTAGLYGTGYDEQMLAALVMVTRPESEIADFDAAAHWVGMPEFGDSEEPLKLVVFFKDEAERERFRRKVGFGAIYKKAKTWSTWWPPKAVDDAASVRFESKP